MANWVSVAKVANCPPGSSLELVVDDRIVALFNVEGTLHALDGVCPHQGGPLGKGTLEGNIVTCPWHGWQFNVCSGKNQLNPRIVQQSWPVRVEGETILIDLGPG